MSPAPGLKSRRAAGRRLALLALPIVIAFGLAIAFLPHDLDELRQLATLPMPLLALITVLGWALLTPALVSGTLLAAGTGLLLGPAIGMPIAVLGATLGAIAAFLAARRLGRDSADALAGPRIAGLRGGLERRPVLTIVIARLVPASPASVLNYAAGLTRIRSRDFVAGTVIGCAPKVLAYTALGGAAAEGALLPALAAVALLAALGAAGAMVARRTRGSRVTASAA